MRGRLTSEEKNPLKPEPGTRSNSCTKKRTAPQRCLAGKWGAGPAYLYTPSEGRLQVSHDVHCRQLLKDGAATKRWEQRFHTSRTQWNACTHTVPGVAVVAEYSAVVKAAGHYLHRDHEDEVRPTCSYSDRLTIQD